MADLRVIARITVNAHTADDLEWNAMKEASTLFRAELDHGTYYGHGSYSHKLAILDSAEAVRAADARDGWVATFRIGLVPVG